MEKLTTPYHCILVPALLNEAVPAAVRDVDNELKHVLLDASRYTGNAFAFAITVGYIKIIIYTVSQKTRQIWQAVASTSIDQF